MDDKESLVMKVSTELLLYLKKNGYPEDLYLAILGSAYHRILTGYGVWRDEKWLEEILDVTAKEARKEFKEIREKYGQAE